jgi:hypothetical protein
MAPVDLIYAQWSVPGAFEQPWPWNDTPGMGKCPGWFRWDKNTTLLTYSHMLNGEEFLRTWNRSDFKTAYVAKRTAVDQMEVYCRQLNLLDNEYRKLSREVLEMVVGDRTTIISGCLVDCLFDHHWKLKKVDNLYQVVTQINNETVFLPRFLAKAQSGETIQHMDGNPLNNMKANLFVLNPTPEGDRLRSLKCYNVSPDTEDDLDDYYESLPPKRAEPPRPRPAPAKITLAPTKGAKKISLGAFNLYKTEAELPVVDEDAPPLPPWKLRMVEETSMLIPPPLSSDHEDMQQNYDSFDHSDESNA